MFTTVTMVAIAASVVGLVGGDPGAASTSVHLERGAAVHGVAAGHWQQHMAASPSDTVGTPAELQAPPPPPLGDHTCARINSDGVRIHSTFNMSSAVIGLAYKGDLFKIRDFPGGGWWEGTDMRSGVHGWVVDQFVDYFAVCC